MRKDAPLAVDLPPPDRDRPSWVKVGVIAAVGFVIGIAWPRVMGVRLGPSAPGESAASAAAGSAAPPAPKASPAVVAQPRPSAAPSTSAPAPVAGPPNIAVQKGAVLACKGDDGESKKPKECGGAAALDQVVAPRLKKLQTCNAAEGQTGKLSFVVNADFGSGRMSWDVGKSSTVGNLDGITTCLKTIFQGVVVTNVAHDNPKMTVAYAATFTAAAPATEEKPKDEAKDTPAVAVGGEATVAWEVALVRDTPKTGTVVARLPRGSKVKLGSVKDGWYAIKYGDAFGSDGFVYHSALGK